MDLETSQRERRPPTSTTMKSADAYSFERWEQDLFDAYAMGVDPKACPSCGRTAFFGPRFAEPDLRYQGCRFCGFWQEVGGKALRGTPVVHGCSGWPHIAHAPYLWWVAPGRSTFACPFCHRDAEVGAHAMTPPSDDPEHPWWKVPQERAARFYRRFWENWPETKGRLFL